jgi:hypothetical protein
MGTREENEMRPIVKRAWGVAAAFAAVAIAAAWAAAADAPAAEPAAEAAEPPRAEAEGEALRPLRVALCRLETREAAMDSAALTEALESALASLPHVVVIDSGRIRQVAGAHAIDLSRLTDNALAVRLGRVLEANYVAAGRASRIDDTYYLVVKIVDVDEPVQTTVSAKAPVAQGPEVLLDRARAALRERVASLQAALAQRGGQAAALRHAAKALAGKAFALRIVERHAPAQEGAPAASAVARRLEAMGLAVWVPEDWPERWREALAETGRVAGRGVDYLLEGEARSACTTEVQGLVSCRVRVVLQASRPGGEALAREMAVGVSADLDEALALGGALKEAAGQACEALVMGLYRETQGTDSADGVVPVNPDVGGD